MRSFKVYNWKRDHNWIYSWQFIDVVRAENESEAEAMIRKKFKFLRNRVFDVQEMT